MTFKMSDKDQVITIYNLRADTSEFIGAGDAYIPAHTGLPALCTDITPPEIPENMAAVFDGKVWSLVEDHRGKTVYDKLTGAEIHINQLGSLPENTVSLASPGEFVKWNGKKWLPDPEAQKSFAVKDAENQKKERLNEATIKISTIEDAIKLNMATDEEVASLKQWQQYRVLLDRIDVNDAPDIEWPTA
ncbi:tail fiber assembly protein [Enterobacter hormaechei]|uniref:tail fiber assembly protein n=1 Tax=Enterobacter hormaechei TaxID=158836 RepID=UPI003F41C855